MRPDEGVLVERAVFVVAGPGAALADRVEAWDALGEGGPEPLLELRLIDGQRQAVEVLRGGWRDGGDERLALGSEPDPGRIDDERAVRRRRLRLEAEDAPPPSLDRQVHARHAPPPAVTTVRRHRRRGPAAIVVPSASRTPVTRTDRDVETDRLTRQEVRADRARLATEGLQEAVAVEPAFTGQPERPERDALRRHPREATDDLARCQQDDVRALGDLDRVVRAKGRLVFGGREVEVTTLVQADIGGRALRRPRGARRSRAGTRSRTATAGCSPASRTAAGSRSRTGPTRPARTSDRVR